MDNAEQIAKELKRIEDRVIENLPMPSEPPTDFEWFIMDRVLAEQEKG